MKSGEQEPTSADQIAAALMLAVERLTPAQGGLTAEQLAEVLASNAQATAKALKPENARHPDVSAFNPKGERDHARPKLARKTFWAGMELHTDELTVTEIELLNSFSHSCEAKNGSWRAELKQTAKDGTKELHIVFPCATNDDRMDLPNGMTILLRELLGGTKAVDPESLAQRVAELEAQLAKA